MKRKVALLLCAAMTAVITAGCESSDISGSSFGGNSSPDEKIWVIATDTAFRPFEYTDENGEFVGIDVDIIEAIAEDQGFEYEFQSLGWDTAVTAVQSGQADAVMAGATISQERIDNGWIFSDGYYESTQTFVVPKDSAVSSFDDLNGKIVAVKNGTAGEKFADSLKEKYDFTIIVYEDSPTMYQDVLLGNSAACVEDKAVIQASVRDENLALRIPDGMESEPAPYGMGIMEEKNQELLDMFNKGLANIKANGEYDEILARYLL